MATKIKSKYNSGTVNEYLDVMWPVLQDAKKNGATIDEMHEIAVENGCPDCQPSTFKTAYHIMAKARKVNSEVVSEASMAE